MLYKEAICCNCSSLMFRPEDTSKKVDAKQ